MKDNSLFVENCQIADRLFERVLGLMGKTFLPPNSGLWIEPCNSIHTFFMRFAIDVVYASKESAEVYKVLAVHRQVRPWRLDFPVWRSRAVLELPSGGAKDLIEGELLCLSLQL